MSTAAPLALLAAGAALSWILIRVARRRALERGALDMPNERSSHTVPTPRVGGVGIVVPALVCLAGLSAVRPAWLPAAAALALAAAVGRLDDVRSLPVAPRLIVHLLAGVAIAVGARDLPPLAALAPLPWLALAAWAIATAAAINVVNFMDGIDGLVGLTMLVYATFAVVALPPGSAGGLLALVVCGALLAFLSYNRPPARVFMGDAGSGGLGVLAVVLGIALMRARGWSALQAWLPLAPLIADELLTMARRLARGERLTHAHRSHVYQELVIAGLGHGRVSLAFAAASALGAGWALVADDGAHFRIGAAVLLLLLVAGMEAARAWARARISGHADVR